jgi:hypothetical protein
VETGESTVEKKLPGIEADRTHSPFAEIKKRVELYALLYDALLVCAGTILPTPNTDLFSLGKRRPF